MANTCEIFSAGCEVCNTLVTEITALAGEKCTIVVRDMHQADVAAHAAALGINSIPSVVIDGVPADCCAVDGPDLGVIRKALGL
ncbi:MAG: hypothetical protein OEU46_18660 [Alphaproteobacteria bacterium]|nr:hypothetical protein [Alphaproteobacteria bacterium]